MVQWLRILTTLPEDQSSILGPYGCSKLSVTRRWWRTLLNPALRRQRQVDPCEFETSLVYTVPGWPGLQRETLSQKNQTKSKPKQTKNNLSITLVLGIQCLLIFLGTRQAYGEHTYTQAKHSNTQNK